ncbi:MAG: amidohydrolase family protein [Desulfurococcales archaeon]|nr:amidohydrolase family protein [Desulfurococcales archaeon]
MGILEAGHAIVHGKIVEGLQLPFPRDEYYETVIIPGFSDAHMHPQVVDAGLDGGRVWSNSYEWIEERRLRVDEAGVRSDLELSARLARAVYKRALLEGVTLVAVTGNVEANVRAWLSLSIAPRAVFLPTIMKRKGWPTLSRAEMLLKKLRGMLDDGFARVGVFIHSIRLAGPDQLYQAVSRARELGGLVGLHLGEGVPEAAEYFRITGGVPLGVRVVAVHCISDPDPRAYGLLCVSCPATNLILYRRTRSSLRGVTSFGSDWPLLIGTVARHLPLIARVFPGFLDGTFRRATIGGYRDYGIPHGGDLVAYDVPPERIPESFHAPKLVMVSNRIAVHEGRLVESGESLTEVERSIRALIREAIEAHPAPGAPLRGDPIEEASRALQAIASSCTPGAARRGCRSPAGL